MALIDGYVWRECNGSDSIIVDVNFSAPSDYVFYKEKCYFNTYVILSLENVIENLNGIFFNSCYDCESSSTITSIPCSLYGQVDIYLNGDIELVLEGQLEGPQLEGQIDIELQGMLDIYLQGLISDPLLNAELELTLNLEACFDGEQPITYSVYRTTNCCGGDTHYVSIPSTHQVGDSFIGSDGVCYQIGSLSTGTEPTIDVEYLFEGGCDVCTQQKPCLTPTPTLTPSVTQTPSNTVTPSLTPTLTPSTSVLLNRYFATRCIESGTVVIEVPEGASVMETYSADDGNCYQLLNTTTDPSTVNAIELKENGCADCVSPTPTLTPTPTPSGICPSCSTYGITNFDRSLTLQITYTDCDSGSSVGVSVLPDSSIVRCSCDDPVRTGGTLDWGFTNNGSC